MLAQLVELGDFFGATRQRLFGQALLGDILQHGDDERGLSLCVAHQRACRSAPDGVPILPPVGFFDGRRFLVALDQRDEQLPPLVHNVVRQQVRQGPQVQFFGAVLQHRLQRGVALQQPPFQIDAHDADGCAVEDRAQVCFAFAQRRFDLARGAYVTGDAFHGDELPLVVEDGRIAHLDPDGVPVLVLQAKPDRLGDRVMEEVVNERVIVRVDQRLGGLVERIGFFGRIASDGQDCRADVLEAPIRPDTETVNDVLGVFRQQPVAGFALAQRLGCLPLRRDVGDEAFEHDPVPKRDGLALLPHPFFGAACGLDPVDQLEWPAVTERLADAAANDVAVVRVNEIGERGRLAREELLWRVAGEGQAAFADEFHRPVGIVLAAVHHARQVAHQCAERALAFLQSVLGGFLASEPVVMEHHEQAGDHDSPGEAFEDQPHARFLAEVVRHVKRRDKPQAGDEGVAQQKPPGLALGIPVHNKRPAVCLRRVRKPSSPGPSPSGRRGAGQRKVPVVSHEKGSKALSIHAPSLCEQTSEDAVHNS